MGLICRLRYPTVFAKHRHALRTAKVRQSSLIEHLYSLLPPSATMLCIIRHIGCVLDRSTEIMSKNSLIQANLKWHVLIVWYPFGWPSSTDPLCNDSHACICPWMGMSTRFQSSPLWGPWVNRWGRGRASLVPFAKTYWDSVFLRGVYQN